MIGPIEQVEFCGHPVVFIAPSGYGPPEVSPQESDNAIDISKMKKHVTFLNF
jgi:hypothetical protein